MARKRTDFGVPAPQRADEKKETKPTPSRHSLKFDTKLKVVVKSAELPVEMIEHAVWLADEAMRRQMDDGDLAEHIKKGFDSVYPPPWHCIVGRRFSSLITHEQGSFLYFFMGKIAIVLFKCKD